MSVFPAPSRAFAATIGVTAVVALAAFGGVSAASAAEPGDDDFLGTAESFVVVATVTVTDAGLASDVYGDVALTSVAPAAMELQEDQDVANGQVIQGDIYVDSPTPSAVAQQVVADVGEAYTDLAAAAPDEVVGGTNLALIVDHAVGLEFVYQPGTYNSGSALLLDGTIVLDGLDSLDSVFIFQAGSSLTAASGSSILLRNGAQACNVYWQVLSDATIETDASFVGTVVAGGSIWVRTGAVIDGQLLAGALGAGEVTLDHNTINGQTSCVRSTTTEGVTTTTTRVDGETTTVVTPADVIPVPREETPVVNPLPDVIVAQVVTTGSVDSTKLAFTGSEPTLVPIGAALLLALVGGVFLVVGRGRRVSDEPRD